MLHELSGHKGGVQCLSACLTTGIVASGGEDSTVRIWDLRSHGNLSAGRVRASLCITRCFDGDCVTATAWSATNEHTLFVAAGTKLLEFDTRAGANGSVLLTVPVAVRCVREDEINSVDVFRGESETCHVAIADDTGVVCVVDIPLGSGGEIGESRTRTLSHAPASICSCARFRPDHQQHLASGALDGTLAMWDWKRNRLVTKIDFQKDFPTEAEGTLQLINPPLVHDLSFTHGGDKLACALGDGSFSVFDYQRRKQLFRRTDAHAGATCLVYYPTERSVFGDDVLFSLGTDGRMKMWKSDNPEEGDPLCEVVLAGKPNAICSAGTHVLVAGTESGIAVYGTRC